MHDPIARHIAALCFGKAVFACSPVLALQDPENRESAYALLAEEFEILEDAIRVLLAQDVSLATQRSPGQ